MKTYIKPNTEVTTVMFEGNLMAGTKFQKLEGDTSSGFELLGKEDNTPVTTNSLWDEEE